MISNNDLYQEINKIEKALEGNINETEARKMMLKIGVLELKLLHNQRTNMVQIMRKIGAQTIEPKEKKENVPTQKK